MTPESTGESSVAISVCIITYNSSRTIDACLQSVFQQDYGGQKYEVIVADGGSEDQTASICRLYPVKLLQLGRVTRGRARNACVAQATGSTVIMIDSDEVLPNNWVLRALQHFKDSSVAEVSGHARTLKPDLGFLGRIVYFLTGAESFSSEGGYSGRAPS